MKRLIWILACCFGVAMLTSAQSIPTLVPPTPIPTPMRDVQDTVLTESGVARMAREGKVRVGVLFNELPFGELSIRGDVAGFDADLARLLAETWGVEAEIIQVTRQNRVELLRGGQIDLLIAALVHHRSLDSVLDFSHTYHVGRQALMVRADSTVETLFNAVNQRIGYVLGTEAERAIQEWQARAGLTLTTQAYLTLDQAYGGLFAGEVDGIVGRIEALRRVAVNQLDAVKFVAEAVAPEPFAIGIAKGDINLRQLVNRTLQYLYEQGQLEPLFNQYFAGEKFNADALTVWQNVGDVAPTLADFGGDLRFPSVYRAPRILSERVVRVAGLWQLPENASEGQRLIFEFNRLVLEQMVARWGASVQYVEGGDYAELLEQDAADLAAGMVLDWALANRIDYSAPYLLTGDRLMVKKNSNITSFRELRNEWLGIMDTDIGARERAQAWADSVSARVNFYSTFEQDAADAMLTQNNADAIYGDVLKLLPHLRAYPDQLALTERWYSRNYIGFGMPRNDSDLKLLVDYTLQEMVRDGSLGTLWQAVLPPNSEAPQFDLWPGSPEFLGESLLR